MLTPGAITIYTIDHSTLPLADFVEILERYQIKQLIDIRTVPRSRTNPQYNWESLPEVWALTIFLTFTWQSWEG